MPHWISNYYDPEIFENPFEFKPQRWEKEESKSYQSMLNYIFSGGPRGCIGKSLALTEAKVFMIKFVQRYENLV